MIAIIWTSLTSILFFINLIEILKKINDGKDTASDTLLGAILIIFIIFGLASLLA